VSSPFSFSFSFDFFPSKPVVVEPSAAQVSSDAGLLPIRQFDERIGLTTQFAEALTDPRLAGCVDHTFLEMTRMRIYGVLADYPDQNDHDVLRSDPIFKLICGRSPGDKDLASQPTLSRFENAIAVSCFFRLRDLMIDQFIASFDEPPTQLTLDIDPFDDPTHGQQQLTFFHAYYDQYQYLPRVITCAENDLVVDVCLLYGSAHAALGAADDLEYVVHRLRQAWPGVHVQIRADSGLGVPRVYDACERLDTLYTIGIGMNSWLKKLSEPTLAEAVKKFETEGEPQRLFCAFWYQAESWPAQRWVVIKCEANAQGTNRRAVVTNRSGAFVLPGAAYDAYTDRGESENRNKELKCGLQTDRLSDHRYFANLFRLYLHTQAHNLLVRMRREIADPLPEPTQEQRLSEPTGDQLLSESEQKKVPSEALTGRLRRQWHNRRRKRDPLGEGQPCTWRTRLIKVGAIVIERSRRIIVQLSASWPYLNHYEQVSAQILDAGRASFDTS
jgi:hypothetical protein